MCNIIIINTILININTNINIIQCVMCLLIILLNYNVY